MIDKFMAEVKGVNFTSFLFLSILPSYIYTLVSVLDLQKLVHSSHPRHCPNGDLWPAPS